MASRSTRRSERATVLIVEPDVNIRRHLQRALGGGGYRVLTASDALSALRLLHQEDCDLIILEAELPGVGGLALCRLLRAQTMARRIPIMILSAEGEEDHKVAAFSAGADDYLVKPIAARELVSRVEAHIEAAQRERELVGTNRELSFLADLGRGLLYALEPEQVVRRVAGAAYEGTNADLCAVFALHGNGVMCVFDREGIAREDDTLLHRERLQAWLERSPATSIRLEKRGRFFLRDEGHKVEYIAPLRFGSRSVGALIVAFDRPRMLGESEARLVDAAAQLAALAFRIATLYATARDSSADLARAVAERTAEAEAQRRFTEAIVDNLPLSLYVVDRDLRIVAWNRTRELGGQGIPREEALGRKVFDVLTRQPREVLEREFRHVFETGEVVRVEQQTVAPDGTKRHWLVSKIPMRVDGEDISHVIAIGEDITARVEANQAVARAEKLAAVGRLAAGVVHEINNPLATISACAEALETRAAEGDFGSSPSVAELREYLNLIRSEAFRCKAITNGLLDFARARAGVRAPVSVASVINSAARLVAHQQREANVEIVVEADEDLPLVSADEAQLQQAIIALATNAVDAMPEGGVLRFGARHEAGLVVIEVSDTGVGIPPEIMPRIFDPFFTTKEVGRGTGLGLAVCYGIVTDHGGKISVESNVGRGSTFKISLPALAN
jgi:two-component system NtrC family sensor kinase